MKQTTLCICNDAIDKETKQVRSVETKNVFQRSDFLENHFENNLFKRYLRIAKNKNKIINVGQSFAIPDGVILFPKYNV